MRADFTLVPIGGLGNRINAICSAIVYCQQNNKSLEILWFKDHGLNCSVKELFKLNPDLKNIELRDAKFVDFLLRDCPRRKNLWLPKIFQYFIYDRRVYEPEFYEVIDQKSTFVGLIESRHLFMVGWWRHWESQEMWKSIVIQPEILRRVLLVSNMFPENVIGIHIRRTDNIHSIKYSPTELFIEVMRNEIIHNKSVCFYVASDSMPEKTLLKDTFGDKIITQMKETSRDNMSGIIDAFVEMNILSRTKKIYASAFSSFSELASFFTGIDCVVVNKDKIL